MKEHSEFAGKKLLVVNTGTIKKRYIFQRLRQLGVEIIILNKQKNWARNYAPHWILADTTSHPAAINAIVSFFNIHPELSPDGVITFWEDDVLLTSLIAENLGLIGIPYNVALQARNKNLFRAFCLNHQIPTPQAKLITNRAALAEVVAELKFPVVMKPVWGAGSAFVVKIADQETLYKTYDYLLSNLSIEVESALHEGQEILVEEYLEGDEVDLDLVMQNGKVKFWSLADNHRTKEPFFVETGDDYPSQLPTSMQAKILALGEEVLEKLGVYNGVVHFEAKVSAQGISPIEINLRLPGDMLPIMIKAAWGVDLIDCAVKIALGIFIKQIVRSEEPKQYLSNRYILADHSGILSKLDVPEFNKQEDHILDFNLFKKVGDPVLVPPEGYDYLGWVTTYGSSLSEAEDYLNLAISKIKYEVSRYRPTSFIGKTKSRSVLSLASIHKKMLQGAAKLETLRKLPLSDIRKLKVGIACNIYTQEDLLVEKDLTSVGKNIEKTLTDRGYQVSFIDFNNINQAIEQLSSNTIDIIFNVCERINNTSLLEPHVASLLDIFQVPYTGSNPFTLGLCIDKIRVKKLLAYHQIPTPNWDYCYTLNEEINPDLKFPLIVKPANTDNSIGITNDSIVTNPEALRRRIEQVVVEIGRPALIEEYIEGDEYDVAIIGSDEENLRVLPLSRTIFHGLPQGYWNIYSFTSKFEDDPAFTKGITVERPPKNISKNLTALISEIALDTYNILGASDYGRVEIRVDKNNNPYVLELNPNPSINIGDCVPFVASLVGMDYGDFLEEIMRSAIKRYKNRPPYYHLQANIL